MVEAAAVSAMDPVLRAIVTLSILIFFAKIFASIFSEFKLPPVIGELIAGIVFSPHALGSGIIIFGEPLIVLNEFVDAFAEIGVIMILFSTGLEMGVVSLRKSGAWAFLVALAGAILPFVAGYYLYLALGYSEEVALLIGAVMVATSIAISVRVLEDFNALKTEEGQLLINAAVIDDVLGVIILAVISSASLEVGKALDLYGAIQTTIIFLMIWAIMVGASTYAIPRIMDQVTMLKAEGTVEAAAIGLTFIMAAIAGGLGLPPIVGSYAAGMAIAESKALVRVKDFTQHINQIFSPIFFTVVGARMNITLFSRETIIGILILTGIASVTKFAGCFATALPKLRDSGKAMRLAVGMIPRGELGLIIATIGLTHNLVSEVLYLEAIGMIILTSFIAPILLSKMCEAIEIEASLE